MIRSSRPVGFWVASTGLAVLLLSGCGSGSVRPGAAALVGESRITVDTLQQFVERGLSDPQAEFQEVLLKAEAVLRPLWGFLARPDAGFAYELDGERLRLRRVAR